MVQLNFKVWSIYKFVKRQNNYNHVLFKKNNAYHKKKHKKLKNISCYVSNPSAELQIIIYNNNLVFKYKYNFYLLSGYYPIQMEYWNTY